MWKDPCFANSKVSNQEWKIYVDFKDIACEERKRFEELALEINEI